MLNRTTSKIQPSKWGPLLGYGVRPELSEKWILSILSDFTSHQKVGAKYLVSFSSRSLKMREFCSVRFTQFVFLLEVLLINFSLVLRVWEEKIPNILHHNIILFILIFWITKCTKTPTLPNCQLPNVFFFCYDWCVLLNLRGLRGFIQQKLRASDNII